MIHTLFIKDFALIDELEVNFGEGFNILTGQTGAGKSIIVGALNMILGERADTEVIRSGAEKAIAEATIKIFGNEQLRAFLKENDIATADYLILRREIRHTGSRAFINDSPVSISVLKAAGDLLVDLHGQHDHQILLRDENHRGVVDSFGEIQLNLDAYRTEYLKMKEIRKQLDTLKKRERELLEKTELYRFQVNELEQAKLSTGEEQELETEMNLLDNAEILDSKAGAILDLANSEETNLVHLLNILKLNLEDLARIDSDFENYLVEINTARVSINEAIQFVERYRNNIEFNPKRLEELRLRQAELHRLQKKYQRNISELSDYLNEIKYELSVADNFDLEIQKLEERIHSQGVILTKSALDLHTIRMEEGKKLSGQICGELANLGIPHSQIIIRVDWLHNPTGWITIDGQPVECGEFGADAVSIYISTNKGEEPKPLAKIASGGEISRIMLALKSILAQKHSLPVMIFDEIDTGISGDISEKVGRLMRRLSEHCQIIAITHQPQIASQAHHHYRVDKAETAARTATKIVALSPEEHITEVARLMSGAEISESALESARELIQRNTSLN